MHTRPLTTSEHRQSQADGLSVSQGVRFVLARLRCRLNSLGAQARRLGYWLEHEVFPDTDKVNEETLTITPAPDGRFIVAAGDEGAPTLGGCRELCSLLLRLGIRRISLATRLESNQIEDVITLLVARQRELIAKNPSEHGAGCRGTLQAEKGLHFNCMWITLRDHVLTVQYSYCVTRLSMAVRWFEQRYRPFADHRALFHAAPRYGALAVVLLGAGLVGYLLTDSLAFLIAATAVEGVIFFAAVYVFMRGMGSIEYDNEENAYRLAQAHWRLVRYADRIRHDLDMARLVQRRLLPNQDEMPMAERIEWAGHFVPASEVGGDYYDAAALDENKVAVVLADVSGHGMAAALITVIVKMAFQNWVATGRPLADFVRDANRDLCRFTPTGSFVVLIAAVYDHRQCCLRVVNAGHSPGPFLVPAGVDHSPHCMSEAGTMLLGVIPEIDVNESAVPVGDGDIVLLATDGLTDAHDRHGAMYGRERLQTHLANHRAEPLCELVMSLLAEVDAYAAGTQQTDDRTVLAFRVRPSHHYPRETADEADDER